MVIKRGTNKWWYLHMVCIPFDARLTTFRSHIYDWNGHHITRHTYKLQSRGIDLQIFKMVI